MKRTGGDRKREKVTCPKGLELGLTKHGWQELMNLGRFLLYSQTHQAQLELEQSSVGQELMGTPYLLLEYQWNALLKENQTATQSRHRFRAVLRYIISGSGGFVVY